MIDIGVNLTNKRFQKDINEVIANAKRIGVSGMIITGTNLTESEAALQLAQNFPDYLFSTAGIHPHDAASFDKNSLNQLRELA
jgi:TatD DNase family protein